MRFSIVIPAYNEEDYLPHCLKALQRQTINEFEIIVVNDDSTDRTEAVATELGATVISIDNSGGKIGLVRHYGCKAAKGDIICNLDADCEPEPDWLEQIHRAFTYNTVLVAGPIQANDKGLRGKIFFFMANLVFHIANFLGIPGGFGCNLAIKKDVYNKIGGFDTSVHVGEDTGLARKASKHGKIHINRRLSMPTSTRRVNEGLLKVLIKGLYADLMTVFGIKHTIRWRKTE